MLLPPQHSTIAIRGTFLIVLNFACYVISSMVHIQVTWRHSPHLSPILPHDRTNSMQNSSADNLPSLSATSPINDENTALTPVKASNPPTGYHDATKPFVKPDSLPKAQQKPITNKIHEAEIRSAKNYIKSKIREDWEWPLPSRKPHSDILGSISNGQAWRERDSDSSYSPPSPAQADPYRFHGPESFARARSSPKRQRQRREALEQEMTWNEGLRIFVERRDEWSGVHAYPPSLEQLVLESGAFESEGYPFPDIPSPSPGTSPAPRLRTPSPALKRIPIAIPILSPANPIRAAIKPATYPSIYSKVVVQGLAPTVPINLKDMVNSLVQGWKKNGEWPPKSEAEKAAAARTGGGSGAGIAGGHGGVDVGKKAVKKSMGKVKKVLGLGNGIDGPGRGEGRLA